MQSDFTKSDGMKYDLKVRWPKSSDFGPSDDFSPSDYQIENGIDLSSRTSQTEQSRPGTAAVRGTHKSTRSDRCVGLRTQARCANAGATPHRSHTTASCRPYYSYLSVDSGSNKKSNAPSARLTWLRIIREYTWSSNSSCWACLLYTSPSPRDKRQSRMPSSA